MFYTNHNIDYNKNVFQSLTQTDQIYALHNHCDTFGLATVYIYKGAMDILYDTELNHSFKLTTDKIIIIQIILTKTMKMKNISVQ